MEKQITVYTSFLLLYSSYLVLLALFLKKDI